MSSRKDHFRAAAATSPRAKCTIANEHPSNCGLFFGRKPKQVARSRRLDLVVGLIYQQRKRKRIQQPNWKPSAQSAIA